jgi:hypothetical protein
MHIDNENLNYIPDCQIPVPKWFNPLELASTTMMPHRGSEQSRSLPPFPTPDSDVIQKVDVTLRRARSFGLTEFHRPGKSNLRVKTQRESLQSSWAKSNPKAKTLLWRDVHIRKYERTVGDNPSCSSGPPLR